MIADLLFSQLSSRLGYQFKAQELFQQALTHRSAAAINNERLEFLGDAVLGVIVAEWLYEKFPTASEGELTRIRSSLVKGSTLAQVAKELDVGSCLILGAGEKKSGGHHRDSILADTVEALIGAIFLESGLDACRRLLLVWFQQRLKAASLDSEGKDYKTRLQEYLQSRGLPLPEYDVVCTEGDPHNQIFTILCTVSGVENAIRAKATNRKKAEKISAEKMLNLLLERNNV